MRAILTYHSIDASGSPISIDPRVFDEHAQWLSSGRVTVVPLARLADAEAAGSGDAVAVTFDDGFQNVRDPVTRLRERGIPVTLFAVTGHAGRTNAWGGRHARGIPTLPLMDWDALASLAAAGVEIGAHTHTHPDLTQLPPAALEEELGHARELLTRCTLASTQAFAYPYGRVDERIAAAVSRHYRIAVTTEFAAVSTGVSPLRLPRLDMFYFRGPGALRQWGTPAFRRRLAWVRARRRARRALRLDSL